MSKMIKKLVVFGATGNAGLATVLCALGKGYEVTAFVRDPKKLPSHVVPTHVIVGDVLNKADVAKAVKEQDAVVVTLGTRMDLSYTTALSVGTKNILDAMKAENIQRISCCVSGFQFCGEECVGEYLELHREHDRVLKVLRESDREWIAVCPPIFKDYPARGDYILKNDEIAGDMSDGGEISKYDVAELMLTCLKDDSRVRHMVSLGYLDRKVDTKCEK